MYTIHAILWMVYLHLCICVLLYLFSLSTLLIIPNYCDTYLATHFLCRKIRLFQSLFYAGGSEIDKPCGPETSESEADLCDTSPSPKDAKVEFVAENDDNASDATATESMHSDEVIEKQRESSSDDSDESEMDQKVLWLDVLRHIKSTKFINK